ncbi:MAG: hypothetical protein HYZ47_03790, partial [Simkania negevensis]|nr:hypothetical protein [Simkania negevensis]
MKKHCIILAFLFSLFFLAVLRAESPTFEFGAGAGYRLDTHKYNIQNETNNSLPAFRSKIKDIDIFQTGCFGRLSYRNWFVSLYGDYGWVLSGKQDSTLTLWNDSLTRSSSASIDTNIGGHVIDVEGKTGYRILLPNIFKETYLIPIIGYAYFNQSLSQKDPHPKTQPFSPSFFDISPSTIAIKFGEKFRRKWSGPLVGGALAFYPIKQLEILAGYDYYWLWMKFINEIDFSIQGLAELSSFPSRVPLTADFRKKVRGTLQSKSAQRFYGSIKYNFAERWYGTLRLSYFMASLK